MSFYTRSYKRGLSRTKAGFTLIELLVVIAIIGILAGIILASLSGARVGARDAQRISELRQIRYALDLYYSVQGAYPACLYTSGCAGTHLQGDAAMPNPPKDPSGVNFTYAAIGSGATCSGYHLGVALEDKTNQILRNDNDKAVATICTNSAADFSGRSNVAAGSACDTTVGTAEPGGTETCYDIAEP